MIKLDSLFSKFKNALSSALGERELVASVVSEIVGVEILPTEIVINNGNIVVNSSPVVKSKIFISRQKILEKINQKTSNKFDSVR